MEKDPRDPYNYNAIRRAAETHRQVRQFAQKHIKPVCYFTISIITYLFLT